MKINFNNLISETAMGVEFGKLIFKSGQFYRSTFDSLVKDYKSVISPLAPNTPQYGSILAGKNFDGQIEIEVLNSNYYLDAVHKYDRFCTFFGVSPA